jgi:hypothetical protein
MRRQPGSGKEYSMSHRHHSFSRFPTHACLVIGLFSLQPRLATAGSYMEHIEARCTDAGIVVHFTYVEDPLQPTGHPEWTQYALRTSELNVPLPGCATGRVERTLAYFPRSGATDDITYVYPKQELISNRYIYFYVEALTATFNHIPGFGFGPGDMSGCPIATTPAVMGSIEDLGWAVRTRACPICGGSEALIREPQAAQLRPFAGTGQAVLLFGELTCSSDAWVGGVTCSIELDHFELIGCPLDPPVPAKVQSWGQVKIRYR